jgi:hypothetical protein
MDTVSFGKPEGKSAVRKHTRSLEDNITTDLKEVGQEDMSRLF